jgi:hypothetical protein
MADNGALKGIPGRKELGNYVVFREGWEVIRQKLYDSAVYPAAGSNQLTFFQLPIGQGVSAINSAIAKTFSDTNMNLAGQLPANIEYLVESIEVQFFPATPTAAAGMPSVQGAQLASTSLNDTYIFYRSGNLQFFVGQKPYLNGAPMDQFPPKSHFNISSSVADATTAAATQQHRDAFAFAEGRPFMLKPASLLLGSNMNFNITLNWPEGLQVITNPAVVRVQLDGFLYRRSQ